MTLRPAPTRSFDAGTATMQRVLTSLRLSLVDESVYEDLEDVLGPFENIDASRAGVLTGRLQRTLDDILPVIRHSHGHRPECARASELRHADTGLDDARVHLRRLALATLDILDLLANAPPTDRAVRRAFPSARTVLKPPCTRTTTHTSESVPVLGAGPRTLARDRLYV
ncbi:hypothetical protein ACWD01_24440 [Streptomyces sp. NPDC002835]